MAQQTITRLIDDLDKGEAEETVRFGLDGVQYEIDLSSKNAAKLRQVLGPYVNAGRKVSRAAASQPRRRGVAAVSDRAQNKAIREWARSKKKKISDRGRIPEEIVAEYHASAGR
jgi:Lsr2